MTAREIRNDAFDAIRDLQQAARPAAFVPGPAVPVQRGADTLHQREVAVLERSIAGDDVDPEPRRPGLSGFLAAMAASDDWGVPVRSTSDPDRFGKGALHGGGGRPHDPHIGREHYALAARELERIAVALPTKGTRLGVELDGRAQLSIWATVRGGGALVLRNIHAGGGPDAIDREAARKAKRAPLCKRKTMTAPGRRRAVLVPERRTMTATDASEWLRGKGVDLTAHEVGLICRRVSERVQAAFEAKGWVRAQPVKAKPAEDDPQQTLARLKAKNEGDEMAAPKGWDLQGWKSILEIVGCSEKTARVLMARTERRLPVVVYLGKPIARVADLQAWQDAEIAAALEAGL